MSKWAIVIMIAGGLITLTGFSMKVVHWSGADYLMFFGPIIVFLALITEFIYKLAIKNKNK
jgi:hypothetical protein